MKALDTGILLALLQGSPKARELVRRLRGTELATTEANLLELAFLAASAPPRGRSSRFVALDKLRQRLTVLPLDARAVHAANDGVAGAADRISPTAAAMMGALQAAGCQELITDEPKGIGGSWTVRLKIVAM